MGRSLRRWWMDLFRARSRPTPAAGRPVTAAGGSSSPVDDDRDGGPPRPTTRRTYPAAPVDDPRREAHLGAVLQALAAGPLGRAELGREVGAADWGPGRLDAVVDHGLGTGVLLEGADGTVRARYAD